MRVLVATVTEQNRLLTANNPSNALIDVLRQAEVDRKNAENSRLEAQTIQKQLKLSVNDYVLMLQSFVKMSVLEEKS